MRQLSIQSRKLNIIEQLIMLDDDMVLKQVEDLLNTSSLHEPPLKRMTKQELIHRAILANQDIENGDVYSREEALRISQNW